MYSFFSLILLIQIAFFSSLIFPFLSADINHRPSEALKASISYKNHVKRTLQKTLDLQVEFKGYLTFEEEERIMRDRLNAYNDDV